MATVTDDYKLRVSQTGAKQTEKAMGRLEKQTMALGETVAALAVSYLGARGLVNAVKISVREFAAADRAEAQTRRVFGGLTDEILRQADAFSKVTTHSATAIKQTQAFLGNMGVGFADMEKATQATVDLAAALQWDLNQAARNVGRTMGGFAGELGEVVPELKNLTAEELKAGKAMDVLIKKFGGAAETETNTLHGAMTQAENSVLRLSEAFGKELAPSIIKASKAITRITIANEQLNTGKLAETIALINIGSGQGTLATLWDLSPFGGSQTAASRGRQAGQTKARIDTVGAMTAQNQIAADSITRSLVAAFETARGPQGKTAGGTMAKQFIDDLPELLEGEGGTAGSALIMKARQAKVEAGLAGFGEQEQFERMAISESETLQFIENENLKMDARKKAHEQVLFMSEVEARNAQMWAQNTAGAMADMASSFGGLVSQMFGAQSEEAKKVQKGILFLQGAAAVTSGVISILEANAHAVETHGGSLAQIPFGLALIAKGGMMMSGAFLTAGDANAGGGGAGASSFTSPGTPYGQGSQINITINNSGIGGADPAAQGKAIVDMIEEAQRQGRVNP
jgi:hypothetical protein